MTGVLYGNTIKNCLGCAKSLNTPRPWEWYCQACPARAAAIVISNDRGKPENKLPKPVQLVGAARYTCGRCQVRPKEDKSPECRRCLAHSRNGGDGRCQAPMCDQCGRKRRVVTYEPVQNVSMDEEIVVMLESMGPVQTIGYMKGNERFRDLRNAWIGRNGELFVEYQGQDFVYTYSGMEAYALVI